MTITGTSESARKTWASARTASLIHTATGRASGFQRVPEGKTVKNRLHIDISVGGGRSIPIETRAARVDAEAQRLVGLGAMLTRVLAEPGA
jgi:Glyoxalase-like domain